MSLATQHMPLSSAAGVHAKLLESGAFSNSECMIQADQALLCRRRAT